MPSMLHNEYQFISIVHSISTVAAEALIQDFKLD